MSRPPATTLIERMVGATRIFVAECTCGDRLASATLAGLQILADHHKNRGCSPHVYF